MKLFCTNCNSKQEVEWVHITPVEVEDDPPSPRWYLELRRCSRCESTIRNPILKGKLIDVPFEQSCQEKFRLGRAEHGPVFLRNPLEEIDMELIDGVNYAMEALRQGYDKATLETIIFKLKDVDVLVRNLHNAAS